MTVRDIDPETGLPVGVEAEEPENFGIPERPDPEPQPGSEEETEAVEPAPRPIGVAAGGNPANQGVVEVGGVTLPSGLTLVAVKNPTGSDADKLFYLSGRVFGVNFTFEVGDRDALKELFGTDSVADVAELFDGMNVISQQEFDDEHVVMGTSDEIVGATESLASQLERDMKGLGIESLPPWMRESNRVIAIMAAGAREGWAPTQTWRELAKTKEFKKRFGTAFESMAEALRTDDPLTVATEILQREEAIRESYWEYRGTREVSVRYMQRLMSTGWSVAEIDSLLSAEKQLRESPGALENFNAIQAHLGREAISGQQLAQVMAGVASSEVMESVNDALRQSALAEQGVEISAAFAASLGDGSGAAESPDYMAAVAQQSAQNILRFKLELDAGKFGLTQEDILSAAFDDERSSEVDEVLAKFARERSAASAGEGGPQGYVDAAGNLRVQGLQGL